MIRLQEAASLLKQSDHILILSHHYPDGDTLGSAAALCRALQRMGKYARCVCEDELSSKYAYLFEGVEVQDFEPEFIVSVDVADNKLLGALNRVYGDRVDLCIDHHGSNVNFAKDTYVNSNAAATCEIIYDVICGLGVTFDQYMATCIYTGITTDTGCFRYTNATPRTYRIAADMMEVGVNAADINRIMFDTKSRARIEMERRVMDSMEFFFEDRCALIHISHEMVELAGAAEEDMEGLSAIPRQVEGVLIGATLRERKEGGYKISLRTQPPLDAAAVCSVFGGGGHRGAAGCAIKATYEETKKQLVKAIGEYLESL